MSDVMVECFWVADGMTSKTEAYDRYYSSLLELCMACQGCVPERVCKNGHCG